MVPSIVQTSMPQSRVSYPMPPWHIDLVWCCPWRHWHQVLWILLAQPTNTIVNKAIAASSWAVGLLLLDHQDALLTHQSALSNIKPGQQSLIVPTNLKTWRTWWRTQWPRRLMIWWQPLIYQNTLRPVTKQPHYQLTDQTKVFIVVLVILSDDQLTSPLKTMVLNRTRWRRCVLKQEKKRIQTKKITIQYTTAVLTIDGFNQKSCDNC